MAQAFRDFYENWLATQEQLLQQLLILSSSSDESIIDHNSLINQVLSHYEKFHDEKAKAMKENPFLMLSPPWLSSYERALLWLSGFKPTMVFQLAKRELSDNLSTSQVERIEMMRDDTRIEEMELEKEMASVQERIASPPIFDLMRRYCSLAKGEMIPELEEAMSAYKERLVPVLECADALREKAASKLMEIFSPSQVMRFLAASAQFTIRTRRAGIERDRLYLHANRGASTSGI